METTKDTISQFLQRAEYNSTATLETFPSVARLFDDINNTLLAANEALVNSSDWFLVVFLGRAHSAFLASVRLATCGQVPETFMTLRGVLENAMYALYIKDDPTRFDRLVRWFKRNDTKESKFDMIGDFKMGNLRMTLRARSERLDRITNELYERCVDFGGHPNQRGLLSAMSWKDGDDAARFAVHALTDNLRARAVALKSVSEVAVTSLHIFGEVFDIRFQLAGIMDRTASLEARIEPTFKPFAK